MQFKSLIKNGLCLALLASSQFAMAADPLPSWNDGKAKESIIKFVESVTDKGSKDFVPQAERIATFDNDGTLWGEQPVYFQLFFAIDQIKKTAAQHSEWKTKQPFAAVLKGDMKTALAGGEKDIFKMINATHAGMSTEAFQQTVRDWLKTAKHPKTGMHYTQMVYQPMLELLDYLRDNQFKTYIVSGGGLDFMRAWVEEIYNIPPEQVIGTRLATKVEYQDGKPVLIRQPKIAFLDDKEGKIQGIHQNIGRRPIAAFGNSDGDLQMIQYATSGDGARFGLFVHHTDGEREFAYDKKSAFGRLDKGLVEAQKNNWTVVDMKNDWKVIYPPIK